MKVIYTKAFPPGQYHGINLFGIIFVSRRWGPFRRVELHHEMIHTLQQRELLYLGFYLLYLAEWVVRLVQHRFRPSEAYFAISFEREAYAHQGDPRYRRRRPPFAWRHYLR